MAKLPELCSIQYGYAFDSTCFTEDSTYLPLVRIRDVKRGYSETFYSGNYPNDYIIDNGSLLVGMDGEFNIARWKGGKALLNQRVCKITARKNVDEEYLRFALTKALKEIENRTSFVTVKHLSAKELNRLEIDIPDYRVQISISGTLTKIENTIFTRQQQLQKLDELVKARFVELFGDPIVNSCKLPVVTLGEISGLITKGASPSWQGFSYINDKSQTLFVTSENVREGCLDLSSPKYVEDGFNVKQKRSVIHKGDFLINIVGASIGRAAQFNLDCKANMNQASALVRIKDRRINEKYLLTYLNSDKAQRMYDSMKSDTGRANLSLQDISNLSILLPPIKKQIEFDQFVNQVDKSKVAVQKSLDEAQLLFDSLMQQYFE